MSSSRDRCCHDNCPITPCISSKKAGTNVYLGRQVTGAIIGQLQRYQGALEELCQAVHNVEQLDNLPAHVKKAHHTKNNAAQVTG